MLRKLVSGLCLTLLFATGSFAADVSNWVVKAPHPICHGSAVNECRNPTCAPEPALSVDCDPVQGAELGGKYHTTESCTNKFNAKEIAISALAKNGLQIALPEASKSIQNYEQLQCRVVKDDNAPMPTDDLCGNNEPLVLCPYLGRDSCLLDIVTFSSCSSEQYCGIKLGICQTILNGLDLAAIPPQEKLDKYETVALSIMEIAFLGSQSGKLSEGDAHAFVVKTVEAAKQENYETLLQMQAKIRSIVFGS